MQVRQEMEAVRNEGENDSRQQGRFNVAGQRARQAKRSVTAEGKTEERRNRVNRQRPQSESKQWKERQGDSIVVLAESQRVVIRIENICVEQMQRVVKSQLLLPLTLQEPPAHYLQQ